MSQKPSDEFQVLREDFDRLRKDVSELADSLRHRSSILASMNPTPTAVSRLPSGWLPTRCPICS